MPQLAIIHVLVSCRMFLGTYGAAVNLVLGWEGLVQFGVGFTNVVRLLAHPETNEHHRQRTANAKLWITLKSHRIDTFVCVVLFSVQKNHQCVITEL
jgi:hypothetical protein